MATSNRPGGSDGNSNYVERLIAGLNPQQRKAVEHRGGPLLIVAGAGSGKTSVLTRRIAYLLAAGGAHPGQILAITFTNKAAAEMRERVADLIGPEASRMWVATFHSICVRILRAQYELVPGRNSNFSIYDGDDARRLLGIIAKEQGLDIKKYTPRYLANSISNHKNELVSPERAMDIAMEDGDRNAQTVAAVYIEYAARLRSANAFDFDDLIGETVDLLRNNPPVAEYYRRRFRHVMVDEYQDTNHAQYVLVRTIVGGGASEVGREEPEFSVPPSELCVVGDADQSIYAFRGATIRNIEDFEQDFPNAETILLEQNYRSTQTILSAANAVISRNEGRRPKNLWTASDEGSAITAYVADNEHDEARFVAGEVDRLVDSGDVNYSDIAVFYRTNNSSRVLEDIFIRLGIPYKVVGGLRFYERKEVRDAVAYLRILLNPEDTVSLRRIINTPRRGIGDKAEQAVVAHADVRQIGFGSALRDAAAGKVAGLGPRAVKSIAAFVEMTDGLRARLDGDGHAAGEGSLPDIGDLLDAVLDASGYRDALQGSNDPQDGTRLDNLEELVGVAREFSSEAALRRSADEVPGSSGDENTLDSALDEGLAVPGSLEAFLERVSLVADADEIPEDDAGEVTLMTLHTAKGLEFPAVFLVGWEDGLFPHMRALGDPAELAEERRLAYVGITRARKRLYISRAMLRSTYGQPMTNPPSRFFGEIPDSVVEWEREEPQRSSFAGNDYPMPRRFGQETGGFGAYGSSGTSAGGRFGGGSSRGIPKAAPKKPALELELGDRVNHDKYGLGKVVAVEGSGTTARARIDFGDYGTVQLMLIGGVPMTKL